MSDPVFTVSEFVEAINTALYDFSDTVVEGEVHEFNIIHRKWVTFKLKDEHSSLGCFMTIWDYHAQLEDGMLVRATGRPTLRDKGFFSFVLSDVRPTGEGALRRAFELLQKKLTAEGLFDADRKRSLPRFPEHIALITSRDAAAYTDFVKVLRGRHGGLTVSFIHTLVQGADAPRSLAAALETANTHLEHLDAIVLVRGGGSLDDLHAFNDEPVVRAVAASRTPTIVGIGHERDVTLAELAADVRASTPSNAAELLVRSREEIILDLDQLRNRLRHHVTDTVTRRRTRLEGATSFLTARVADTRFRVQQYLGRLQAVRQRFSHEVVSARQRIATLLHQGRERLHAAVRESQQRHRYLARVLYSLSPEHVLRRGYSITRGSDGTILKDGTHAAPGDTLTTTLQRGTVSSRVIASRL